MGFLLNFIWLHKDTARQLAILGVVSFSGSYLIWFLLNLAFNTIRVPWLLDVESGQQINALEKRALVAENKADDSARIRQENTRLHELFGILAEKGAAFLTQIAQCQTKEHFASWNRHFGDWLKEVQQAMRDMKFPTDAVEFARAGDLSEPVTGIVDFRAEQEHRRRVAKQHQNFLVDFVNRKLALLDRS